MAESFPPPRIASKLVRDRIPGQRIAPPSEYFTLLVAKLQEEAAEVARARTNDEIMEEMGDVLEVCYAIAHVRGIALMDLFGARRAKLAQKGGFELGVVQDG